MIEDLQVGRTQPWVSLVGGGGGSASSDGPHAPTNLEGCCTFPLQHEGGIPGSNGSAIIDAITDWIDQLVTQMALQPGYSKPVVKKQYRFPLPPEITRIDCVGEACMLTKAK